MTILSSTTEMSLPTTSALVCTTVGTPAGPLTFLVHGGAVVAAGFTPEPTRLQERLPADLRHEQVVEPGSPGALGAAVEAYLGGETAAFDAIPVRQAGGPFLQQAWAALRTVPAGTTITYTDLAARAGRPAAIRAAASACARNLIAPIVPCHRVLRRDGSLGGYYWGLPVKRWLLEHEGSTR